MVVLLNLLVFIVIMGLFYAWWKTKKHFFFFIAVLFLIIYPQIQPSYMPKGDIPRTSVPSFEASNAEIEDRNRKPVPSEVRQAEQERMYKEGPVFIQK